MQSKDYVIIGVLTLVVILTATFTSVKSSKETSKVHDAVMVIDTLKLPQIDEKINNLGDEIMKRINANDFKIEIVAKVADRAEKNSGWANNRAAKLEEQIKELTQKLDSLKAPQPQAANAPTGNSPFGSRNSPFGDRESPFQ